MGWSNQVVQASEVIIAGAPDALYVYSGTPGPGDLVASIVSHFGTDRYGNTVNQTITAYGAGGYATLSGAAAIFGSLTPPAGAVGGSIGAANFTDGGLQVASGLAGTTDTMAEIQLSSAQTAVSGTQQVITDPLVAWQPGLVHLSAEIMHAMTLLNGWTTSSGSDARYKLLPDNMVLVRVNNLNPGTTTDGTAIWDLPAGYVPASGFTQTFAMNVVYSTAPAYGSTPEFRIAVGSTSALEVFNLRGTVTNISGVFAYSLD